MNNVENGKIRFVPAVRGILGSWVYYSALLSLRDVSDHVKVAEEIHPNKKLSEMIQRELKKKRADEIADYLCSQQERFLNSIVVAVYGDEPKWYALSEIQSQTPDFNTAEIKDRKLASVGFLRLSGEEIFFALDGQHRLEGIRKALKRETELAEDEINVIFVAHKETDEGRRRTRRLFTTLKKSAKPVSKGAIIALDEDDTMAIVCRRLVEEHEWFAGQRILYTATNNMPITNRAALTTIGALYDALTLLFCNVYKANKEVIKYYRPTDHDLDDWHEKANSFFELLYKYFSSFQEFCDAGDHFAMITAKYRNIDGGGVLFRPIGLLILIEALGRLHSLYKGVEIEDLIRHLSRIPWMLNENPFINIIWDSNAQRMVTGTKVLCRELVLFVAGVDSVKESVIQKYAKAKGVSETDAEIFISTLDRLEPLNG